MGWRSALEFRLLLGWNTRSFGQEHYYNEGQVIGVILMEEEKTVGFFLIRLHGNIQMGRLSKVESPSESERFGHNGGQ